MTAEKIDIADGVLCVVNSSINFEGVEQASSLRKGFDDPARGVLARVELSLIGLNKLLRSSKSGLKGFFHQIGVNHRCRQCDGSISRP